MSAKLGNWAAMPMQKPWTATITGLGWRQMSSQRSTLRRSRAASAVGVAAALYSDRSTPALKPLPAPRIPITGAPLSDRQSGVGGKGVSGRGGSGGRRNLKKKTHKQVQHNPTNHNTKKYN